jgi:hypothetical protein
LGQEGPTLAWWAAAVEEGERLGKREGVGPKGRKRPRGLGVGFFLSIFIFQNLFLFLFLFKTILKSNPILF